MIRIVAVVFLALLSGFSLAQSSKSTLSGYLKDSLSGETIIGATISINGQGKGVNSNQYGFYSITLPHGEYELSITHVGYTTQRRT